MCGTPILGMARMVAHLDGETGRAGPDFDPSLDAYWDPEDGARSMYRYPIIRGIPIH